MLANLTRRLAEQRDPTVGRAAVLAQRALDSLAITITKWSTLELAQRDIRMRRLTKQLAHVVTAALLVEDAGIQASKEGSYRCLVMAARYLRRYIYPPRDGLTMEDNYTPFESFDALIDWTPEVPAAVAEPLLASLERE